MPRLFIGCKISPGKSLLSYYTALQESLTTSKINWVDPENFHITLKFLGDVGRLKIAAIQGRLEQISFKKDAFELWGDKFGYFGKLNRPTVLWMGFQPNKKLQILQRQIDDVLVQEGFDKEDRKYFPHLTLARVKYFTEPDKFQQIIAKEFSWNEVYQINEFQLIESKLASSGPSYFSVKTFQLSTE